MKWTPHDYQLAAAKFLVERPQAALFSDPGLGKTSAMLAAFKVLQENNLADRMLVIAPLTVAIDTWPDEIDGWDDFEHLAYRVLHGPKKDRLLHEDADIYVINPEGVQWLEGEWKNWEHRPNVLVVDELTKFKHTNTKRFKTLKRMLDSFDRRYGLTGTPAANGLLDLFGQTYVLDGGKALGRYITHYRQRFFYQTGFGGYTWLPFPGAEEEIYDALRPLVLRQDADDHLDLPPIDYKTIGLTMPAGAMKKYKELEKEFVLQLQEGEVNAMNAGALTSKLRQFANGAVYLDEEGERSGVYEEVHKIKLEALSNIVESLQGQPVLVVYQFRHDLNRIKDTLEPLVGEVPHLSSKMSASKIRETIATWNRGGLGALLLHESFSHGLNLQHGGRHVVWFGLTYNLENYEQLNRRLWRQGQEKHVFVHRLTAKHTIDLAILKALRAKDRTQSALLAALKEHYA